MTATLDDVTRKIKPEPTAEQLAAEDLVRQAGLRVMPRTRRRSPLQGS
jgi:hypothetical protein